MDQIKIISWNVRGACGGLARDNVKQVLFRNQANVLMLQETKCKSWSDAMRDSIWSLKNHLWVEVDAVGLSGGLVLSWESDLLTDVVVVKNQNWIWIRGLLNNKFVNMVNVYGPISFEKKRRCFRELIEVVIKCHIEPLCLIGDFNCVSSPEDRVNCNFKFYEGRLLKDLIDAGGLWDIPLSLPKFTWFGPQGKKSRIDRAIVNQEWFDENRWHLNSLPRKQSDHRPLFLFTKVVNWGSKPFKARMRIS